MPKDERKVQKKKEEEVIPNLFSQASSNLTIQISTL
jgi:hypothetical protein